MNSHFDNTINYVTYYFFNVFSLMIIIHFLNIIMMSIPLILTPLTIHNTMTTTTIS